MLERQTIDGRDATVAYFDDSFNPVDRDTPGCLVKVFFDDGETVVLRAPDGKLKIHGYTLATWARAICHYDAQRIATAISVGLTAGEDNTDIAHRVIGSRRNNGVDGTTEITRQHVYRLGHGLLHERKIRMGGHPSDV